jgi:tripartite-type tricarboxylate transporter receptor subunit TctC
MGASLAHWPLQAWAQADAYPSRTVRILVPLSPGGSADAMCRLLANGLTKVLGKTVIVDNRPGSGGITGLAEVARATPDGYTLGYSLAGALTVAPHLVKKMPFDPLKDLAPLSQVVAVPEIVVAHPKLSVRSLQQLIAYAKARPGKLNFGSAGNATIPHLGGELLKREAQIDMVHVPYKGSGPALNDLLAGQVEVMVSDVTLVRSHIESGRLVGLAVAGPSRIAELPGVPTTTEQGLPGMVLSNWHGMVAPAGTPPVVLALLQKAIQQAMALPEVKARVDLEGADAVASSPVEFAAFLRRESASWDGLVKSLGIRWE